MRRRRFLALPFAAPLAGQSSVKALTFDVFGTVVDWRSSIIREGQALGKKKGIHADWAKFADQWRAGYGPAMNRVRKGELPWTKIDDLHRMTLNRLLDEFRITALTETEKDHFNRAWHRLDPWPDAVDGLRRLRRKYTIATLSNGNVSLLADMAKYAGLPWDVILSAELARRYKPDREVYLMAAELLSLSPAEVMMVAAHKSDLDAARNCGLKTAFVTRPLEFGPDGKPDLAADPKFDVAAKDFLDLAARLGA
ncbi:MAG: haloacid dehalogenase type II [Acidobacteria bacterium]|nr:haloacid dehalogenase type II [Acidobacteriota bacterium]